MKRAKRTQTEPLHIQLLREGILESVHQAQAVVCDAKGRVLMAAGDPETETFIRSSLKPFQALAAINTGTLDRFSLSDRDLAIMCASHQGSVEQSRQAFNILWHCDVDPSVLQCPIPTGKRSPLEHNCSGKHAGMLAVCQQQGWPLNDYLRKKHPVQQLILSKVAELLHLPPAEMMMAQDDCGAPTVLLSLHQMATLYAQLASGDQVDMERVVRAMTYHPTLVSGDGAFDTEVIRLSGGQVISKAGAEGIQCMAFVGEGLGLAIKVMDGAKRAKYAAAIALLQQLGWVSSSTLDSLAEQFMALNSIKRLDVLGELTLL
ncbi:MAG: asparaginase [Prochlorothrix sp.]|nr:asparaginase [Prochlorothrix sp.]